MNRIDFGKIVKLFLMCVAVGLLLAWLGVTPDNFWESITDLARRIAAGALDFFEWAWTYFLLGAAVVLPIYLVMFLYRKLRGR